jgi:hypothetical protein
VEVARAGDQLQAIAGVEFVHQMMRVRLDDVDADYELGGNLRVVHPWAIRRSTSSSRSLGASLIGINCDPNWNCRPQHAAARSGARVVCAPASAAIARAATEARATRLVQEVGRHGDEANLAGSPYGSEIGNECAERMPRAGRGATDLLRVRRAALAAILTRDGRSRSCTPTAATRGSTRMRLAPAGVDDRGRRGGQRHRAVCGRDGPAPLRYVHRAGQ